jgi:thiamine pyrophosphate-dependent acetolactate synthase large subunit-like protein
MAQTAGDAIVDTLIKWRVDTIFGLPGDAKLDGQPVLAITGLLQFHDLIGTRTQQDVALDRLFMDVAIYNERIMGAAQAENIKALACRTALARNGVAQITIPVDIQDQAVRFRDQPSRRLNIRQPFVPPNPKLFDSAYSICIGRA